MTNNRQKGKRFERYFKNELKSVFPEIRRNAGTQAQSGGVDLENTGFFDFECKSGKKYKSKMISDCLKQVKEEGSCNNYKAVLIKPDREEPYAVIPFQDFLDILHSMKAEGIIK